MSEYIFTNNSATLNSHADVNFLTYKMTKQPRNEPAFINKYSVRNSQSLLNLKWNNDASKKLFQNKRVTQNEEYPSGKIKRSVRF